MTGLGLPDLLTLQALRRAEGGALTWCAGQFFDDGHLVGLLRSDVLGALAERGLVELSALDADGVARVGVSAAGPVRRAGPATARAGGAPGPAPGRRVPGRSPAGRCTAGW